MATRGKRVEETEVAGEAADEATILHYARKSKGGKGLFGSLINAFARTYVPELHPRVARSTYAAGAKSFAVKVLGGHKWTITAGDDVIDRAPDGKVADLAEELRGAVAAVAEADIDASRTAIIWIGRERVRVSAKDQIDAARRTSATSTSPPAWSRGQAGCHSSTRLPSGSVTQPNRPTPSMFCVSLATSAPLPRSCASIASRSRTRKLSMIRWARDPK
jgi:hypothetical protein